MPTVMLSSRRPFIGLIAISAAVALCSVFVDRPLALWLNARFYRTTVFTVGALILRPLDSLLVAGLALLVVAMVSGRLYGAPSWVNRFIVSGASAAVALVVALVLKVAIGRSQVYPPFLQDHIYDVRPFAGSKDFMAFPSATMAGVAAFTVSLVVDHRRADRAAAAVILGILAAALVITASHWLSDIIGGTYLGIVSGAAVARRLRGRDGFRPALTENR
jgi:hypothetical protein